MPKKTFNELQTKWKKDNLGHLISTPVTKKPNTTATTILLIHKQTNHRKWSSILNLTSIKKIIALQFIDLIIQLTLINRLKYSTMMYSQYPISNLPMLIIGAGTVQRYILVVVCCVFSGCDGTNRVRREPDFPRAGVTAA